MTLFVIRRFDLSQEQAVAGTEELELIAKDYTAATEFGRMYSNAIVVQGAELSDDFAVELESVEVNSASGRSLKSVLAALLICAASVVMSSHCHAS